MLVKVPVWSVNLCCLCPSNRTIALCRFNAGSTAVSLQSPLNGGEESQGSPQLRGIKGCHSLLSGPLTLRSYLNHEQHKYCCVRESLKRLHSLSLWEGGRRELVVCEAKVTVWNCGVSSDNTYVSVSLQCAVPSYRQEHDPRQLAKGSWEKVKAHVLISKFVFSRSRECWQRSVLIHFVIWTWPVMDFSSFYIPLTGVSKTVLEAYYFSK